MSEEHRTNEVLTALAQYRTGDKVRFWTQSKEGVRNYYEGEVMFDALPKGTLAVKVGSQLFKVPPNRVEGRVE
jgi:hypothetical protein